MDGNLDEVLKQPDEALRALVKELLDEMKALQARVASLEARPIYAYPQPAYPQIDFGKITCGPTIGYDLRNGALARTAAVYASLE